MVIPLPRDTLARAEQPEKAEPPSSVTLSGMSISAKETQPKKAHAPMVRTPSPIVTSSSAVQPRKASRLIA